MGCEYEGWPWVSYGEVWATWVSYGEVRGEVCMGEPWAAGEL